MAAQDNMNPQQFFHSSPRQLEPGTTLRGGKGEAYPRGETWRGKRVWVTTSPEHAQEWSSWGKDNVYEVRPRNARQHTNLTDFDGAAEVSQDAMENQRHAPSAQVIRKL